MPFLKKEYVISIQPFYPVLILLRVWKHYNVRQFAAQKTCFHVKGNNISKHITNIKVNTLSLFFMSHTLSHWIMLKYKIKLFFFLQIIS